MPDASDGSWRAAFDIEGVPDDSRHSIAGTEGLDANHASRLRMQFLVSQNASLVTLTQFADAKAAALMALLGLVALNGPAELGANVPRGPVATCIFVLMILAIGFSIWAIVPRFPGSRASNLIARRDRFSWTALVGPDYGPMEHARFMRSAEASQLVMSIAQSNAVMARVLRRKFLALRIAFALASADLLLIVLYVVGFRLT